MQGSDVDLTQGKMAGYRAEGADYRFQVSSQRKQQFSTDNGETEFDFYGVKAIFQDEPGEIVQEAQVASKQPACGGGASSSGKARDFPGADTCGDTEFAIHVINGL
jgi:hypothetical protein